MVKQNPLKNILLGLISAAIYGVTVILVPLLIMNAVGGIASPTAEMRFWIIAIGMVVISLAFGRETSPRRSVRKVIFNALLTLANMFYIYSYWLSGIANIDLSIPIAMGGVIGFQLNLGTLLAIELGVIGLKIIVLIYDLIDAIVYWSKRKTKIKVDPGEEESDTFAAMLEDDGGR